MKCTPAEHSEANAESVTRYDSYSHVSLGLAVHGLYAPESVTRYDSYSHVSLGLAVHGLCMPQNP